MRTKTGSSRRFAVSVCAGFPLLLLILFVCCFPAAVAADKGKNTAYAILAGTVFRDAGFAMRGAEVVATPDPIPEKKKKKVEWRAVSDARGEFFLRLPAGPASYTVVVRANGYKPQEKKATFSGDERLDFNFLLEPGGGGK